MNRNLITNRSGFGWGYTVVNPIDSESGIELGFRRMKRGETWREESPFESAWLLLSGSVRFGWTGGGREALRASIFDEDPCALHLPAGSPVTLEAFEDCELAVSRVRNDDSFEPRFFDPSSLLESEHRGRDILDDTAYRIVRTIFDYRNRPEGNLVLGEVINFPGRWSSYPPHHHEQPELYHYRFTRPQGYGFAQLGDEALVVREFDTLVIDGNRDHPQTAAPGYGMYYIWVIRHLDGNPYRVPEYAAEHAWAGEPGAVSWKPPADPPARAL